MKQCGNISGRSKPTPSLYPSRSLTKQNKKRKRARSQKIRRASRTRLSYLGRRRAYTARRRRRPRVSSARRASRRQAHTESPSSSSGESDDEHDNGNGRDTDSKSNSKSKDAGSRKRSCRKPKGGGEQASSSYNSKSESYQESIPASKHMSLDASQYNPVVEKWDLTMAQATNEPQQRCASPRRPTAQARGTSPATSRQ